MELIWHDIDMMKVIFVFFMDVIPFDGYAGFWSGTARAGLPAAFRGTALLWDFDL